MVIGGGLGIVAGRSRTVYGLLENVIWIFLAIPSVVWVFVFAIAFGIGDTVPIAALSALLVPMVLTIVAEGARVVPNETIEMADAFKAGQRQRLIDIYLPHLVPYFTASARSAFALGMKVVLVAEVIGLPTGVGFLVLYSRDQVFMSPIVAWGIVFIIIGLLVDRAVFANLEARASRWQRGSVHIVVNPQ